MYSGFGFGIIQQYQSLKQMRKQFVQTSLQEYDVERILDERKERSNNLYQKDKTFYLVKWKGYSHEQNTWQPYCHLKNVPQKIRQWKNRRNKLQRRKQEKNKANQPQHPLLSSNAGLKTKIIDKTNKKISPPSLLYGNKNIAEPKQTQSRVKNSQKSWEHQEQQIQTQQTINASGRSNEMYRLNRICQKLKNQSILIEISDSSSQQSNEAMSEISGQEEIIVEQSVSDSQESNEAAANIDPPQFFLNFEIPKTDMDKQNFQRQSFFQAEKLFTKKNTQKECYMKQSNEQLRESVLQNEYLQNLIPQNNFSYSVLGNQSDQNQIKYENLYEIVNIYKEKEVLYCSLTDNDGFTVQKMTYESIQANRPDLIAHFFTSNTRK